MKKITIRARNFIGALLGGTLGILGLGYIHPYVLPVGCLLGVVLGWWYQEIWMEISQKFRQGIERGSRMKEKTMGIFPDWLTQPSGKKIAKQLIEKISFPIEVIKVCKERAINWLKSHPMNKALTLSVMANLLSIVIVTKIIQCLEVTMRSMSDSVLIHLSFIPIFFSLMASLIYVGFKCNREEGLKDMGKFYQKWTYLTVNGPLRYFLKEIKEILSMTAYFFGLFLLVAVYYFITGPVIFVLISLAYVIFGITRGFYLAVTRSGHWLCLGVTLTVTGLSAWMALPLMSNKQLVWGIALLTGLASAAVTEAVTQFVAKYLETKPKMKKFISEPLSVHFASAYKERSWKLVKRTYNLIPDSVRA